MKKTRRKRAFQHNISAANAVINELRVKQKALVIQSTGTGKSYVMREIIEKFPLRNVMVVGPSWKVLTEVRGILDTRKTNCTIEYATYIGLAKKNINTLPTGLDAIIIDEVHHLPAPVWGRGVKELKNVNPQAKLIGFTGTPKRTDGIDISQSHFNGETTKMDYVEAWEKGILPTPKFINVYFKVDENPIDIAKSYLEKKGISDTSRVEAEKAAKVLELEWNRIKETQSKIIKQHLRKTAQKIIVFFDNISDLEKFSGDVESWFKVAGFNPTPILVHSKLSKDVHDCNWEQTLLPSKNGELKLIMSVNMLNEGVHIPEVGGVMFLRRTVSSIIYLQQLGRCMKSGQRQQPTVFDFVGNIESAGETISTTFNKNVVTKVGNKKNQRPSFKLKVYEYGKNIIDTLSKIKRLTFGGIPPKLLKAHETGDYSEIKIGEKEYYWMKRHRKSTQDEYYASALTFWNDYQEWKKKNSIPPKLLEAHKTGDYSEIKCGIPEYAWIQVHRLGGKCCYYPIADIMWKELQEWREQKKLSNVPPKLLEAYKTGDYSWMNKKSPEYRWLLSHSRGGKDGSCPYPMADTIWNDYKKRKNSYIVQIKLQEAHKTGDYSEIKKGTSEYTWILAHKSNGQSSIHFPIADIMWKELQEWREKERLSYIPPKLLKAYETGDYSEIKRDTSEYGWLLSHSGEGKDGCLPHPKADIIWNDYKERKKKNIVPPKLLKAHETGDYSEIKSGTSEYQWMYHHAKKRKGYDYYAIALTLWDEFKEWIKKRNFYIPPKLFKAHETGDYSEIKKGTPEYQWVKLHKEGKSKCKHFPIADTMWREFQEWKEKNIIPPKLLKARETGDYSEIKRNTLEYRWMQNHKNNGFGTHYPIADITWNEYQEWQKKNKK